ncbi:hypothetical protein RCL1_000031 [Eukaryota sp. TZLM3-RCL]
MSLFSTNWRSSDFVIGETLTASNTGTLVQRARVRKTHPSLPNHHVILKHRYTSEKGYGLPQHESLVLQQLNLLNNPHILQCYGYFLNGTSTVIVLEQCDCDLSDVLTNPLSLSLVFGIAQQLLSALVSIHDANICHRDIKLKNIFVKRHDFIVKLGDFGVSKQLIDHCSTFVGTLHYLAPEIIKGSLYNCSADVYSLGVVFYYLLFNKLPFNDRNLALLLQKIESSSYEKTSRCVHFFKLIQLMMSPDPYTRPTAREALDVLRIVQEQCDCEKLVNMTENGPIEIHSNVNTVSRRSIQDDVSSAPKDFSSHPHNSISSSMSLPLSSSIPPLKIDQTPVSNNEKRKRPLTGERALLTQRLNSDLSSRPLSISAYKYNPITFNGI